MRHIVAGSRKSQLALTQSGMVLDALKQAHGDMTYEIKHIVTKGDRILDVTLSKIGGKGLFVKEIEEALFSKEIDCAVHSMKDMPSELPEGLEIVCIPERVDYRDAYIARGHIAFEDLPSGAVVGTSSLRRSAQLLSRRPDIKIEPLRGNIDTRLKKLKDGHYDAIILAAAGLKRVGIADETVTEYLDESVMVPAVGQGALAIECRAEDRDLIERLKAIHDDYTGATVAAERAFLGRLQGGCQVPIGAHCKKEEGQFVLTGFVGTPDGKIMLKTTKTGTEPGKLGMALADELIAQGAQKIVDDVKREENSK